MKAKVYVSYNQLAVFNSELENPFNAWTDQHLEQGFAWRPGSVSFEVPGEYGHHEIIVCVRETAYQFSQTSSRVIEVPFTVTGRGVIELGSISETFSMSLDPGNYNLIFELDSVNSDLKLTFLRGAEAKFAILKSDMPGRNFDRLLTSAEPAVS